MCIRDSISHVEDFTLKGSLGSITVRKYFNENSDTLINQKQPLIYLFSWWRFCDGKP